MIFTVLFIIKWQSTLTSSNTMYVSTRTLSVTFSITKKVNLHFSICVLVFEISRCVLAELVRGCASSGTTPPSPLSHIPSLSLPHSYPLPLIFPPFTSQRGSVPERARERETQTVREEQRVHYPGFSGSHMSLHLGGKGKTKKSKQN